MTLLFFLTSYFAHAQALTENFKPGDYQLVRGKIENCGDGKVEFDAAQNHLMIGYLHGFFTKAQKQSFDGDMPGDEGCKYLAENKTGAERKDFSLIFTEQRNCNGVEKHSLTKTAVIRAGSIELNAVQTGEPHFSYDCKWELKAQKPKS